MFVWFIKQKDLVPQRIFDIDYLQTILKEFDPYSQTVGNYYNAILQNLFFATLNRAIEDEQGNKRKFATNIKKDIKTLYRYAEMFNISENDVVTLLVDSLNALIRPRRLTVLNRPTIMMASVATTNVLLMGAIAIVPLSLTICSSIQRKD